MATGSDATQRDCLSQQLALRDKTHYSWCDSAEAPTVITQCAQELAANCVFFNSEIALNEQRRDDKVEAALEQSGIQCERHHSFTHLPPGAVTKPDGSGYTVFTPFKKRWLAHPLALPSTPLPPPESQGPTVEPEQTPNNVGGIEKTFGADLWEAGEAAAQNCLSNFLQSRATLYSTERDLPDQPGTSQLSPHKVSGSNSPGQSLHAASRAHDNRQQGGNAAIETWISELIWREFYNHILAANPRLSRGEAFRRETENLEWNHNQEWLERWQAGQTGFPLVDAGMRQLNSSGWMHNRLRMVTSHLVKHLYQLARGRALLYAKLGRRRFSCEQRRLAMERVHRNRCGALFPHVQPNQAGGTLRPQRHFCARANS